MKKILSIIMLIILPLICVAEQYTLEELINIGLEKSYDIQKEMANIQNSQSYHRNSIYGVLPSLTVGADRAKVYDPSEADWNNSGYLTISKSFSLNEPSYYNIRTSIYNMKNAELSMEETQKQIAYYVFSSYLGVLELQETMEIQTKNLELQNKIQQQIQVQFDAGDKSLLELKQSEVSLIDYEIAVNEAANELSKTRIDLFSYLNISDSGYDFVEPNYSIDLEEKKFQFNNVLEQKLNTLKTSELLHFQTTMNFLPTLSIGYGLGHVDTGEVLAFSDYYRSSHSLYLNVSWDVFGLLDKYESYSRSKRNLKIQNLEYQTSKRDYGNQLTNLQNDLATIQRSFDLYEEKLLLADENLSMAQEQFRLGMISLLDLDRSKIEFQNTQLARIQKHYQLMRKQEEINLLLSDKILGKW
jgi:outer membrane protein